MKDTYDLLKEYMIKPKGMFLWRDIPDCNARYQISNHGEVCSVKNKILSGTSVLFIRPDKSRQFMSRRRLFKSYWNEDEQFKGEERWRKIDCFGEYYISNFENIKNCKRLVLWPTKAGTVVLTSRIDNKPVRQTISVLKLFLNTFPPYEIEVNEEAKTVNWKKE